MSVSQYTTNFMKKEVLGIWSTMKDAIFSDLFVHLYPGFHQTAVSV